MDVQFIEVVAVSDNLLYKQTQGIRLLLHHHKISLPAVENTCFNNSQIILNSSLKCWNPSCSQHTCNGKGWFPVCQTLSVLITAQTEAARGRGIIWKQTSLQGAATQPVLCLCRSLVLLGQSEVPKSVSQWPWVSMQLAVLSHPNHTIPRKQWFVLCSIAVASGHAWVSLPWYPLAWRSFDSGRWKNMLISEGTSKRHLLQQISRKEGHKYLSPALEVQQTNSIWLYQPCDERLVTLSPRWQRHMGKFTQLVFTV